MPDSGAADVKNQMLEISNAVVSIYKARLGRGPTKVRADYAGPDVILCTLEDSMLPVETTMIAAGEIDRVRNLRSWFQYEGGRGEFVAEVERITGREVRGFVSGTDVEKDISTEVFYLEPRLHSID